MKQNLVSLSVNISRAYEISKAGGHTMAIVYNNDEDNKSMPYNCETLRNFYGAGDTLRADIVVELSNIEASDIINSYSNRYESIEDIQKRIDNCQKDSLVPVITITGSVLSLLKVAIDKLNLSIWQVNSIIAVSITIAKISQSDTVMAEHIAEAIQYQSFQQS